MNQRSTIICAAILGGLAVAIGAFGAHALKNILTENNRLDTFETAVRYHFYHVLVLLATGILMQQSDNKNLGFAALFFVLGIIIFSGSLYTLCLTGVRWLGAVTPLGGVLFIAGWVMLALGVAKR